MVQLCDHPHSVLNDASGMHDMGPKKLKLSQELFGVLMSFLYSPFTQVRLFTLKQNNEHPWPLANSAVKVDKFNFTRILEDHEGSHVRPW